MRMGLGLGIGAPSGSKPPVQGTDFNPVQFIADNAVAYWKMDGEGGGDVATEIDVTGNGNTLDGSLGGDYPYVNGSHIGGAREFLAAETRYLSRPSTADLSIPATGDFITAVWYKPNAGIVIAEIVLKDDMAVAGYGLIHDPDDGYLEFKVVGGGGPVSAITDAPPSADNWHLVIARYNGATQAAEVRVDNGSIFTSAPVGAATTGSGDFVVGANPGAARYFDGLIDDTLILKTSTPMPSEDFDALCSYLWSSGNGLDLTFIF